MSKLLFNLISTLVLGISLILIGCSSSTFKGGTSKKDDDLKNKILNLDQEKIQELLQNTNQDGKKVSVCMYYKEVKDYSGYMGGNPSSHQCDAAIFNVIFNGNKLSKKLNLNNGTKRTVTGISGKTYTVGYDYNDYTNSSSDLDLWTSPPVPGNIFEGAWKNNKFVINTTCGLTSSDASYGGGYGGRCHEGIASFSLIGKVTLNYEGQSVDMYLTASESVIDTGREYTYNFSDFTLEKTEYSFGDYCELNK